MGADDAEDVEHERWPLWGADPECEHEIYYPSGGGYACRKCPGWLCI